ncbi:aldehyde dehydrogenase family protein [Shigella flexneri]
MLATREPVGGLLLSRHGNFPMAMLTRKLGPALAAGCTGVIKPANNTPLSAFAPRRRWPSRPVCRWCAECGRGSTSEISDAIMASHDVRKISSPVQPPSGKTLVRIL